MPTLHALLLTDVVDSTRLTEELGDAAMAGLWTVHDRVARDLLPLWRGREIDKTDGMLLLFDDVHDAVGYALDYHRALDARELPFKARAGIHVGPVILRPNPPDDVARGAKPVEVDGLALPIAARVMSVAMGAQTLLSADARLALGVAPQRVMSHGHWRLHGVADPVELFEVGELGEVGRSSHAPFKAPPDGAKVYRVMRQGDLWQPVREVRHSVPAERDSFVGRQEPLELLAKKFEDGARCVSVLGMGGTGKTRFVTRFAWTWLGDYPGGVWFCDLSQARTVDGIHFAVAQGLDVPLGKTEPVVQLAHAIAGRGRCLVILDNFEQVARFAEETLGRWLDRAPLAQFLVTTREVLGIVGEETLALAPLPGPDAAALFVRRAESAHGGFKPDTDDLSAIHQLVTVLDGLPLAIELAASRVSMMSPQALLSRMHERFGALLSRAGRRDRQATLRAAFDWSWELLSGPEKSALAQLSIFEGGFFLPAAESMVDLSPFDSPPKVIDVVSWLIDKSLVRRGANERFDLLESVREYASQQLRTADRYPGSGAAAVLAVEIRHGLFFGGLDIGKITDDACIDMDNVVAACRRATARGDGHAATTALSAAWGAIRLRGPFRAGLDLAEAVAAIEGLSQAEKLTATMISGFALELCGKSDEARERLGKVLSEARQAGNRGIEGRSLNAVGRLKAQHGDSVCAAESFERALALARLTGDRFLECSALNNLGTLSESKGAMNDARRYYAEALQLAISHRERLWEGGSAGNLARLYADQGEFETARPLYETAVSIACELGDRHWEANARCNLGLLHFSQDRAEQARAELQAALATAREMGHIRLLSTVQCNLGLVAEGLGDARVALACQEEAIASARELGDARLEGQCLGYLGLLHARQSRFAVARQCIAEAFAKLQLANDPIALGIAVCAQAETEYLAGNLDLASSALVEASQLARELTELRSESEFGRALHRVMALTSCLKTVEP